MSTQHNNYGSCVICGRPRPSGYDTCGASYCQEARHYNNVARNARKNSVCQREALVRAEIATNHALELADRRSKTETDPVHQDGNVGTKHPESIYRIPL